MKHPERASVDVRFGGELPCVYGGWCPFKSLYTDDCYGMRLLMMLLADLAAGRAPKSAGDQTAARRFV